jgi:WXG100 family type VII secretion target
MTIRVVDTEFHATAADLLAACDLLSSLRARALGEVGHLLDVGWTGSAAAAFASGWEEWLTASAALVEDLTAIAALLRSVHGSLTDVDERTATWLS